MAGPLPIYDLETELVAHLREQRRLIISAPTGSGKSTQVPQMLLRHGLLGGGQVVILQPRRLAARLLAARVAEELGVKLGHEVGYAIRFENVSGPDTRIKFVTEGVLLRQMLHNSSLQGISALIFDEFHERHLYGDITLAQALELQERARPDLRLLVMSATLDLHLLENYLAPCATLRSEGRMFPVEIEHAAIPGYANKCPIWEQAADALADYVSGGGEGDALIFMPGSFEINQTLMALRERVAAADFVLLPLHGELPPQEQDAAVARHSRRKVVVATNVAETSLTIDGIRLVIDGGLARIPRYDAHRGINTLLVEKISRASADQRAGRAGRTAPGTCLRLWSREEDAHRAERELPEIKRLDLAEVVLTLKAAGVADLRKFRWLEPPEEQALAHAEALLTDLGALEPRTRVRPVAARGGEEVNPIGDVRDAGPTLITGLGRKMLAFPLHPRYSRMLLAAQEQGCVHQACLIAALTQGRDLLLRNAGKDVNALREDLFGEKATSDFWILMRAWNYAANNQFRVEACRRLGIHAVTARQVGPLFHQFLGIAEREGLDVTAREVKDEAVQKCVLLGFSDHVGRRLDAGTLRCDMVHGRRGVLARDSVVQHSPLLVVAEVREVEGRDVNTILSLATAVDPAWLRELFPEDITSTLHVQFDVTAKRVVAAELVRFRDLALEARRVEPPPTDEAARLLATEVVAGRLQFKEWDHDVEQWILRLNLLSRWCPELALPPITDADRLHLIEQLCHGAFSSKDIKDRDVRPVIRSWLSAAQCESLEAQAPERIELMSGRRAKVSYVKDAPPFVAVKIQDLYGVTQTPRIAMGRTPVVVHILTPGMKPIQVTQDLASFWRDQYPKVKQELQRKYPKHEWR